MADQPRDPVTLGSSSQSTIDVAELAHALPDARWWIRAAVVAGTISGLLMLLRLDALSLNGDEGFTAQMVKLPWSAMLSDLTRIDYNMSLHYIVLKAWSGIFGTSEAALRFPSVIAALAALPLLCRLVNRLFGPRLASLSVILLALNPYFLRYALTARPYGFLILWSVVATLALLSALSTEGRRRWLLYGLVAVVGLHIHLTALMVIGAHGLFTIFRQRRLSRLNLEALTVIAVVGLVPTFLFLAPTDTLNWIGPFTPSAAVHSAYALGGAFPFGWIVIGLAAVGIFSAPRPGDMRWLPAVWLTAPVAAYLALAPYQSMFVDDYFAGVVAPCSILAAFGLDRLLGRVRNVAVPAALSIWTVALAVTVLTGSLNHGQGWRELVPLMADRVEAGDAVAFPNAFFRIVVSYYSADPLAGPFPPGNPVLPNNPWGAATAYQLDFIKRTGLQANHDVFEPEALAWERIWVVGQGDRFDRALIEDLISHGYIESAAATSEGVFARLFTAG